jgi:hypothetical protein
MTRGLDPERVNKSFVLHQAPAVAGTLAIATVIWLLGQTVASRADA